MTRTDVSRRSNPSETVRGTAPRPASFTQIREGSVDQILVRILIALFVFPLFAAACGGGGSGATEAGSVVIRDISVDTVDGTDITAMEPADDSGASNQNEDSDSDSDSEEPTATTLPQAGEESPQEDLFGAIEIFQSCMTAEGTDFIGIPDPSLGDDAPQNQQPYIESLILCATRSDIQNKIAAVSAAQAALTPDEIESQNRDFLLFRDCMIGRGWLIPDPVPNDIGLLFNFTQTGEWKAPPGEELINSDDVGECQDELAAEDS